MYECKRVGLIKQLFTDRIVQGTAVNLAYKVKMVKYVLRLFAFP